jgi:prepilin-type N-terminal cleavage/methylation domain-containing protein/prepilin-type processing-associated H-X9-DG protein
MKTKAAHRPFHHSLRGFTLTELLVVIAIIVVVAALSVAGIHKLRGAADKTNSMRNLAQLQIANTAYSTEHQGNYVPLYTNDKGGGRSGRWPQSPEFLSYLTGQSQDTLDQQTKDPSAALLIATVPLSMLDPKVVRGRKLGYDSLAASYGMSETGLMGNNGAFAAPSHNLNMISNPSRSMAFATATDYRVGYGSRFKWDGVDAKTTNGAIAYRHSRKALVVYFDGHVGEITESDMRQIDSSKGGQNSAFWKPTAN